MAAFDKNLSGEFAWKYSYLFVQKLFLTYSVFNERTILLFCFEVAFNIYLIKIVQTGHSSKISLDWLTNGN